MMYVSILFSLLFGCINFCEIQGILCYECGNMPSHKDCMKYGRVTRCLNNQQSCETEFRFHKSWPTGMKMTTKCKQKQACLNNFMQNRGNCKPYQEGSACHCCCHDSRCNTNVKDCWKDVEAAFPKEHSKKIPRYHRNRCKEILHIRRLGRMTCTNDTYIGSKCSFYSYDPTRIPDFNRRCEKNRNGFLTWMKVPLLEAPGQLLDLPKCTDIATPMENRVVSCTNGNILGSTCTFDCINGHIIDPLMIEFKQLTCSSISSEDQPQWNGLPPFCMDNTCEVLDYNSTNYLESCEKKEENEVGTECTFSCKVGYMLIPLEVSKLTCLPAANFGDKPQWSDEVPTCSPLSCAGLEMENGDVECSKEYFYGSTCRIICFPGYSLSPENLTVMTCRKDLTWSSEAPICVPSQCRDFNVSNANVFCSNNTSTDSVCFAICSGDTFAMIPEDFTYSTCLSNGSWSQEIPCCVKKCPPNAPMDMVIVMDSSRSIKAENWKLMKEFVINLIGLFNVGPYSSNFALFRYTRKVDRINEILLSDNANKETITEVLEKMPYKGNGTWTGVALGHAAKYSLHSSNGNRENYHDIVLILTDGQNNIEEDVTTQARLLLQKGAVVLVIAVHPEKLGGFFSREKLSAISGEHEERVFTSHRGFQDLEEIHQAIIDLVCKDTCENS